PLFCWWSVVRCGWQQTITVITPSPTKRSAIKKPESWSWQTQPLLTCSSASVMLLRLMPDTQGN
ncbi:hypothetical protein V6253_25155, partial [Escherichia coli]